MKNLNLIMKSLLSIILISFSTFGFGQDFDYRAYLQNNQTENQVEFCSHQAKVSAQSAKNSRKNYENFIQSPVRSSSQEDIGVFFYQNAPGDGATLSSDLSFLQYTANELWKKTGNSPSLDGYTEDCVRMLKFHEPKNYVNGVPENLSETQLLAIVNPNANANANPQNTVVRNDIASEASNGNDVRIATVVLSSENYGIKSGHLVVCDQNGDLIYLIILKSPKINGDELDDAQKIEMMEAFLHELVHIMDGRHQDSGNGTPFNQTNWCDGATGFAYLINQGSQVECASLMFSNPLSNSLENFIAKFNTLVSISNDEVVMPNLILSELFPSEPCNTQQTFTLYRDNDEDGYPDESQSITSLLTTEGEFILERSDNLFDCNDNDADINPNASEICDGIDNNCNNVTDEGVLNVFYVDVDGDKFIAASATFIEDCSVFLDGYVLESEIKLGNDCNDNDAAINPEAEDSNCDGIDDNCDGSNDEDSPTNIFLIDFDGDGFADPDPDKSIVSCRSTESGYIIETPDMKYDCDDTDFNINPSAEDIGGDGIDSNCDGVDGSVSTSSVGLNQATTDIYPNPTQGVTAVTSSKTINKIVLYDTTGRMLKVFFPTQKNTSIDLQEFTPGIYLVRILHEDSESNRMLSKF